MKAHFCDLVDSEHARSEIKRRLARARVEASRFRLKHQLSLDNFQLLSEWQHLALREMVRLKGFAPDFDRLADRLDIGVEAVAEAWERLLRLNLVWLDADGVWRTADELQAPVGKVSSAIQQYHRQTLDLARKALDEDPAAERYFSSIVVPMNPEWIAEVSELLRAFRRSFESKLPRDGIPTDVFCLSMNFFNLTREKSKEKSI